MSIVVNVNGESINYPQTGDTNWGDEATDFAVQTSSALAKVGLSTGTTVDIPGTLDVTGNTTLDANLSVGGNASVTGTTSLTGNVTLTNNLTVNGNTQLGNANTDTIGVTGIVNVDAGTLYVDPVSNRVGINKTSPAQALDVVGDVAISGNETVGGTLSVTGDVAINTNKFNVTASSGNTTIAGTLGVTGNTTFTGQTLASDGTALLPGISFSSDTNTGIYRISADRIGIATNGSLIGQFNTNGIQALDNFLHIQDQKPSGTAAQSITSGAWRTRDLNTVLTNRISGASLSSNAITLPAGTYFISAITQQYRGGETGIRIYQTSGTPTTLLLGVNSYMGTAPDAASNPSLAGEFVLTSQQTIELQQRVASTANGGTVLSYDTEVYSNIGIWKKS